MLNHSTLKIQHLSLIIIPILCFLTFQAIKNSIASILLNNTDYFLQSLSLSDKETTATKLQKAQTALQKVNQLTPNEPAYYNLLANAQLWQALIEETSTKQAQQSYQSGLQIQPNNPYLWLGLAKTDLSKNKNKSSLTAMELAAHYAPSDKIIQKNAVFWTISQWQQLTSEQKNKIIEHLKLFIAKRTTNHKTREQLNKLIKETGQRAIICSKLPRTNNFKSICL